MKRSAAAKTLRSARVGLLRPGTGTDAKHADVEQRSLDDYDTAFGLDVLDAAEGGAA